MTVDWLADWNLKEEKENKIHCGKTVVEFKAGKLNNSITSVNSLTDSFCGFVPSVALVT